MDKKNTTKNKHKESKYVNVNTIETSGRYDVKKIILMNKNGMTSSYKYADIASLNSFLILFNLQLTHTVVSMLRIFYYY